MEYYSLFRLFYGSRMRLFKKDSRIKPGEDESLMIRIKPIIKPKEYAKEETVALDKYFKNSSKNKAFNGLLKVNTRRSMISSDPNSVRPETKKKVIIINHKNDDWNLEVHGGIKMWVNTAGEVSLRNPYEERKSSNVTFPWHKNHKRTYSMSKYRARTSVYSSSNQEVQELFELLDPRSNLKLLLSH